jgi:ribosomal protein S18 acetylase RimI-like enzyme
MPGAHAAALPIRSYAAGDEAAVIALWRECELVRPWNDPRRDIARKMTEQPELFLVVCDAAALVASAMAGFDGHRGWVYYLAVARSHRRLGLGQRLMREIEQRLLARGCPKINLQVRTSNAAVVAFYRRLGYEPDDVVSLGRRLIPDTDARA